MKKKLGDFTLYEVYKLSNRSDCDGCAFNKPNETCEVPCFYGYNLEAEIEVSD